jgi:hypothetical protein
LGLGEGWRAWATNGTRHVAGTRVYGCRSCEISGLIASQASQRGWHVFLPGESHMLAFGAILPWRGLPRGPSVTLHEVRRGAWCALTGADVCGCMILGWICNAALAARRRRVSFSFAVLGACTAGLFTRYLFAFFFPLFLVGRHCSLVFPRGNT